MLYRFKILTLVLMILFSSLPFKNEQANANALVDDLTDGAGKYINQAIGLSGLIESDLKSYTSDVKDYANDLWQSGKDMYAASLNKSIETALKTGNTMVQLGSDYTDSLTSGIRNINDYLTSILVRDYDFTFSDGAFRNSNGWQLSLFSDDKLKVYANGEHVRSASILLSEFGNISVRVNAHSVGDFIDVKSLGETVNSMRSKMLNVKNTSSFIGFAGRFGLSVYVADAGFERLDNQIKSNTNRALESIKSRGVVLPINDAVPFIGEEKLRYDPNTDTYLKPNGDLYDGDRSDINWSFPDPKIVKDTSTGLDRVATPTVNPSSDGSLPGKKTGTWTDVLTGETFKGDIPIDIEEEEEEEEEKPVEGDFPSSSDSVNKQKKKIEDQSRSWGALITNKFPFSLPWDLYHVLSFLNASPKTPIFKIDEKYKVGNMQLPFKFNIDLSFLDPYIGWFRTFIILGFMYGLILLTRRLLGGAQ